MRTAMGRGGRMNGGRGGGGRRLARFGAVSLVVVMLAMALLPLTSSGVSAARDDFKLDPSVVQSVDLANPDDPTPTPVIDDLVVTEVDPTLIDDLAVVTPEIGDPVGVGTVQINNLGCESDFGGDYNQLAANCVSMDAPFAVFSNAGEVDFGGSFTASDIPEGAVTVSETVPDGYGEPIVFCDVFDAMGGESGFYGAVVENGAVQMDLAAGAWIYCDWFNVPSDPWMPSEDGGTITIVKWLCPAFDAVPVEPELGFYQDGCTESMNGVEFTLDYPANEELDGQVKQTGDDGDGTLIFGGVEALPVTVTETIPAGYGTPLVFCSFGAISDEDGDGVAVAIDGIIPGTLLENGVLEHEMLTNETLYCNWFNFETPDHSIQIYKYDCPEGIDAGSLNLDELMVECDQPMSGIDFTLSRPSGGEFDLLVGVENTDDAGTVSFADVDPGTYHLTEAIPTGYGMPVVYCGPMDGEAQGYPVTEDGMIGFDLDWGVSWTCYWFNIPTDYHGSITIEKYTCPEGYEPYLDGADPVADCTDATDGIEFTLTGEGIADMMQMTGDYLPGAVQWDGLEAGDYGVIESVPDGYYAPYVICQWYDNFGPFQYDTLEPYNAAGGAGYGNAIDLPLYEGTHIICKWFNVPETTYGGDLVVIKYWCDGHVYTEDACEYYASGADFLVGSASGEGDPIAFTTGWDGTYDLALPAGSYTLTEVGRDWCRAESDQVDDLGNVVVYDGETSYVTVFNCGPGKEKEPPVKKFPNTGVAPAALDGGVGGGTSGLLALLAAAQIAVIVVMRSAKLNPVAVLTRR